MTTVARYPERATAEYARTLARSIGAPVKIAIRFGQYVVKTTSDFAPAVTRELAAEGLV